MACVFRLQTELDFLFVHKPISKLWPYDRQKQNLTFSSRTNLHVRWITEFSQWHVPFNFLQHKIYPFLSQDQFNNVDFFNA